MGSHRIACWIARSKSRQETAKSQRREESAKLLLSKDFLRPASRLRVIAVSFWRYTQCAIPHTLWADSHAERNSVEITKDKVVSIDYTLTGDGGEVIDSSKGRDPLNYLHGAGNIIPGLENALNGKNIGDQINISIPPEQGYGLRDPKLSQVVARSAFQGADPQPGMQFQGQTQHGPRLITVTDVQGDDITIDANHPLAGKTLNFDVTIKDVRDATAEEIQHGHVHGAGGHHH
jgi:FKBP-type peptidyl-prolyl cis-trans isomerase SlyD